jgi:hypothetical protein
MVPERVCLRHYAHPKAWAEDDQPSSRSQLISRDIEQRIWSNSRPSAPAARHHQPRRRREVNRVPRLLRVDGSDGSRGVQRELEVGADLIVRALRSAAPTIGCVTCE